MVMTSMFIFYFSLMSKLSSAHIFLIASISVQFTLSATVIQDPRGV